MPTLFENAARHIQVGDLSSALDCYLHILAIDPEQSEAGLNAGVALLNLGRFHEALPYLKAAVIRSPSILTCGNLAICLFRLTHFDEADVMFRRVLAVDPDNAEMNFNLACNLLAQGRYIEGWQRYAWRHKPDAFPGLPTWQGQELTNQSLAIVHEQGFGDSLLLSRYVIQVRLRVPHVSIICPMTLDRLFARSYGVATYAHPSVALYPDYQCSMFDLPAIFQTISTTPYLSVDPVLAVNWQQRIATLPPYPNVGVVWSGNLYSDAAHVALRDSRRSLTFDQLAPLFAVGQVNFISLQVGEASKQAKDTLLPLHDWTAELNDFAETAALAVNLDLIITVDTAIVHLAAALGRSVWVLNRYDSVYPWLPHRPMPWYDTVEEFRQPSWGDWPAVIQQVQLRLEEFAYCSTK